MFISFNLPKLFVTPVGDEYQVSLSFDNVEELKARVEAAKKENTKSYSISGKAPTVSIGKVDASSLN